MYQATVAQANLGGNTVLGSTVSTLFNPDTNLPQFLNSLFKAAIIVGAILAVLRLSYAGFMYMMSDLPGTKVNARAIISNSVLGLLLLLSIWIILQQINPNILNLDPSANLTAPDSESASQQGSDFAPPAPDQTAAVPTNSSVDRWCAVTNGGVSVCKTGPNARQQCLAMFASRDRQPTDADCVFIQGTTPSANF